MSAWRVLWRLLRPQANRSWERNVEERIDNIENRVAVLEAIEALRKITKGGG